MAAQKRKYEIADFKEAIEAVGASPSLIAEYLGCTRGTVYSYLRKYPELKTAFESMKGSRLEDRPQFTYEKFLEVLPGSRGIKMTIAQRLGCSRQTVDNALKRWPDLQPILDQERECIVDLGEVKLLDAINNDDMRAILFVLETLGKNRGWTRRTELTGANGESLLLSDEAAQLIRAMGMDAREVLSKLEAMIRMQATAKGVL